MWTRAGTQVSLRGRCAIRTHQLGKRDDPPRVHRSVSLALLNSFACPTEQFRSVKTRIRGFPEIAGRIKALGYKAFPSYMQEAMRIEFLDLIHSLEEVCVFSAMCYVKLIMGQVDYALHLSRLRRSDLQTFLPLILLRDAVLKGCENKKVKDFLSKEV
jgi:hypothetical protein